MKLPHVIAATILTVAALATLYPTATAATSPSSVAPMPDQDATPLADSKGEDCFVQWVDCDNGCLFREKCTADCHKARRECFKQVCP